jgi:hypothetical protein
MAALSGEHVHRWAHSELTTPVQDPGISPTPIQDLHIQVQKLSSSTYQLCLLSNSSAYPMKYMSLVPLQIPNPSSEDHAQTHDGSKRSLK